MPFLFLVPHNETTTDPIGIHLYSDFCEGLRLKCFLSTSRGGCCDLVAVYLFYAVSLFFLHILSMQFHVKIWLVGCLTYFSALSMEILTLTGINTRLYTTLLDSYLHECIIYYNPLTKSASHFYDVIHILF